MVLVVLVLTLDVAPPQSDLSILELNANNPILGDSWPKLDQPKLAWLMNQLNDQIP